MVHVIAVHMPFLRWVIKEDNLTSLMFTVLPV